jgi:hypothetical protein
MGSFFSAGGTHAISAAANAIITGTEFGLGGFAGGFVGTLAGGGSLRDAFKAGGIGFGIGFAVGGLAGYTYATGFQDFLHGFDVRAANQNIFVNQIGQGNYAGASQSLAIDNTLKVRVSGAKVHFSSDGGIGGIRGSGIITASKSDGFTYLTDLLPGFDSPNFTANTLELKNLITNQIDPSKATSFVGLNAKNLPITMQPKYTTGWMRYEYLHPGNINLSNTQVYGYYPNNPVGHAAYYSDVLNN